MMLFRAAGKACDEVGVRWAIQHRWARELHGLPAPPDKFVPSVLVANFQFQRLVSREFHLGVMWLGGGYGRLHLRDLPSSTMVNCAHAATALDEIVLDHAVRLNGLCVEPIESLLVQAVVGPFLDAFSAWRDQIDWALVDVLLDHSEPGDQRRRLAEWRG